jgi:hypothetical protein
MTFLINVLVVHVFKCTSTQHAFLRDLSHVWSLPKKHSVLRLEVPSLTKKGFHYAAAECIPFPEVPSIPKEETTCQCDITFSLCPEKTCTAVNGLFLLSV